MTYCESTEVSLLYQTHIWNKVDKYRLYAVKSAPDFPVYIKTFRMESTARMEIRPKSLAKNMANMFL